MPAHIVVAKTTTNIDAVATHSVRLTKAVATSSYSLFMVCSGDRGRRERFASCRMQSLSDRGAGRVRNAHAASDVFTGIGSGQTLRGLTRAGWRGGGGFA